MTNAFGGGGTPGGPSDPSSPYQSQATQTLQYIANTNYPNSNADMETKVTWATQQIKYMSNYMLTMQQGIDQANEGPGQKISQMAGSIANLFGGGSIITGIDLGDLKYYIPAIGALFGFSSNEPFPINLFTAAEQLFTTYIAPLTTFITTIQGLVNGALDILGIDSVFVDAANSFFGALNQVGQSGTGLVNALVGLLSIFQINTNDGVNDTQTIIIRGGPTGGTFTLTFGGHTTTALNWDATAAQIFTALTALSSIGANNVMVSGGPGPNNVWNVTFVGSMSNASQSSITASSSLTGGSTPTVTVQHTTTGATGDFQFQPFQNLWHSIGLFFGGGSLADIFNIVDPVFVALAPWVNDLAIAINSLNIIINAFSDSLNDISGVTNFAQMFTNFVDFLSGGYNVADAWLAVFTATLTAAAIPLLDASKIVTGAFSSPQLQGLTDAISQSLGGSTGKNFSQIQTWIADIVYAVVIDPIITSIHLAAYLPISFLGNSTKVDMLYNPTLLVDSNNWNLTPSNPGSRSFDATYDQTTAYSGLTNTYGSIKFNGTGNSWAQSNFIPIIPGQPITGTAYYFSGSSSSTVVGVQWAEYDINFTYKRLAGTTSVSLSGSSSWTQVSTDSSYVASSDTTYVQLQPYVQFASGGTCWFSNFNAYKSGFIDFVLVPAIQETWDTIVNAFNSSGIGHTISDITYALTHIPAPNISTILGPLAQDLVPTLDATWNRLINSSNIKVLQHEIDGANLCLDPYFTDTDMWTGSPGSRSTLQHYAGAYSWLLVGQGTGGAVTMDLISNDNGPYEMQANAGDFYNLSIQVFSKTGNAGGGIIKLVLYCLDSSGNNSPTTVAVASETEPVTGSWSELSGQGQIPSGYDRFYPQFILTTSVPSNDNIYIDAVVVREITYTQSLLDIIINTINNTSIFGHKFGDIINALKAFPADYITAVLGGSDLGNDVLNFFSPFASTFPKVFPFLFGTSTNLTLATWVPGIHFQEWLDGFMNDGGINHLVSDAVAKYRQDLATIRGEISQHIVDGLNGIQTSGESVVNALQRIPPANLNSLLGLANFNADFQAFVTKVMGSFSLAGNEINNLLTVAGNQIGILLQNINSTGQFLANALVGTWTNIYTAIGVMTNTEINNIVAGWSGFLNGLGPMSTGNILTTLVSWGNMVSALGAMSTAAITTFLASWGNLFTALGAIGTSDLTHILTSWSALVAALGSINFANITSANGNANLGADVQQFMNFFGSTFPKTFPFTFGTSTNLSISNYVTQTQLQQFIDGLINDGTQGVNSLNDAAAHIKQAINNVAASASQNVIDGVNAAEHNLDAAAQALFALPAAVTGIFNNLTGGSVPKASQAQANIAIANSASSFAGHSAILGALNSTTFNGGTSETVNFWEYPNGNLPSSIFTSITSGGGSGGNQLQIQNGLVVPTISSGPDWYGISCGTDYHSAGMVLTTLQGANAPNELAVRVNSTGTQCVFATIYEVSGVPQVLIGVNGGGGGGGGSGITSFNFIPNAYYQLIAGTIGSLYQFYVLCNGIPICSWLDVNQVSNVGFNNRYVGFTATYNGPPYGYPSPVAQFTAADQELYSPGPMVTGYNAAGNSTGSGSFVTLGDTNSGTDQVTAIIGSSGKALVFLSFNQSDGSSGGCLMSFVVTGANSQAVGVPYIIGQNYGAAGNSYPNGIFPISGFNPGITTFTAQYASLFSTSGVSTRRLSVLPL